MSSMAAAHGAVAGMLVKKPPVDHERGKVWRVIFSCETFEQWRSAERYVRLYLRKVEYSYAARLELVMRFECALSTQLDLVEARSIRE
jgi:hypothetical protein